MNNNWWQDFRISFFGKRGVVYPYIGVNVIIFIVVSLASVISFYSGSPGIIYDLVDRYLAFPASPDLWLTHFYTLFTYQFFHADFFHILFNMLWLYWMGQLFLDFLKPRQFHFIYIGGGIMGAIFFALMFNTIPQYTMIKGATVIGASASVMAIFTAVATLVPNYNINLILIGPVKIKYLLAVYIFLDILSTEKFDGGSLAHLGGVIFGFAFIKSLQNGRDLSSIFQKKPKLKVVKTDGQRKQSSPVVNQKEVDAVLDKINKSGYDKLTKEEKEVLFRASKN